MNVALHPQSEQGSLNIISLCTGGGGLDLGVELAIPGARTVCMVEREAFACATLVSAMEAGLLAPAPIWSDARTFNGRQWRGLVDGLIGGIPCQPHSLAGKRLGQADERDLWSVARRIIVQSGAWFVLIENVRGMLSSGGAERVWRDLQRLGFALEGGLFTAAEVRAPHERERLFILAVADGNEPGLEGHGLTRERPRKLPSGPRNSELADSNGQHDYGTWSQWARRRTQPAIGGGGVADAICSGRAGGAEIAERQSKQRIIDEWSGGPTLFPPGPSDIAGWRTALASSPDLEPTVCRVADGMASRMDIARIDRLRQLGNGVVPLEAAYALRTLATRLAAKGCIGAAQLVSMMEAAE
ncbi:DNA cytosine methyltransferase [Allorhizobium undicola]|uniref:DNA cytosine methyltransferase n=1 Tax=Allorhizobium undicola TaxID=78527 RepID=UPI003D34BD57